LPMILETPKGPDMREDRENLAVLRSLVVGRGETTERTEGTEGSEHP